VKEEKELTPSWLLAIQHDLRSDEMFVNLPTSLTDKLSWKDGDFLVWTPQRDGSFKVSKVQKKK